MQQGAKMHQPLESAVDSIPTEAERRRHAIATPVRDASTIGREREQ